jgi:hypothetical protein
MQLTGDLGPAALKRPAGHQRRRARTRTQGDRAVEHLLGVFLQLCPFGYDASFARSPTANRVDLTPSRWSVTPLWRPLAAGVNAARRADPPANHLSTAVSSSGFTASYEGPRLRLGRGSQAHKLVALPRTMAGAARHDPRRATYLVERAVPTDYRQSRAGQTRRLPCLCSTDCLTQRVHPVPAEPALRWPSKRQYSRPFQLPPESTGETQDEEGPRGVRRPFDLLLGGDNPVHGD